MGERNYGGNVTALVNSTKIKDISLVSAVFGVFLWEGSAYVLEG